LGGECPLGRFVLHCENVLSIVAVVGSSGAKSA
jgi:hypothetical protein